MKTLEQFKAEKGVDKIQLFQGTNRKMAFVGAETLFFAKNIDTKKQVFISEFNRYVDPKDPSKGIERVPNTFLAYNTSLQLAEEL